MKFGSDNAIWKLSGVVDGHMIKMNSMTSDKKGNIYTGDRANSRILKINSLTGDIVSILLLEEESNDPMRSNCSGPTPNRILH